MPQRLTNYDAEIRHGVLRLPPNCARLTKGEKRKAIHLARTDPWTRHFTWSGMEVPAVHYKVEFSGRKGNRPNVTVWISVPVKKAP